MWRSGPKPYTELSDSLKQILADAERQNPGWETRYIDNEQALLFLNGHFPEVVEVWDGLKTGAFKADLLRYCLLYFYGGVWLDLTSIVQQVVGRPLKKQ